MTTKKEIIAAVKTELKLEALNLRNLKSEIKQTQKAGKGAGRLQMKLVDEKSNWRHKFIAYCLSKGRKLEEIENKNHEDNKPNLSLVQKYITDWSRYE